MPHYVKKLGKKNYCGKLRSVRVFSKNCASNFFWIVGKGVANGMNNDWLELNEIKLYLTKVVNR